MAVSLAFRDAVVAEYAKHKTMVAVGQALGGYSREAVRLALNEAVAGGVIPSNPFAHKARREARRIARNIRLREKQAAKAAHFWARVGPPNKRGCREWQWGRYKAGYGELSWNGKSAYAHRVAYELAYGEIPGGRYEHQVLHHCDNPPCCLPEHLYHGSPADNMRDRDERGRNRGKTHAEKDHEPDWSYSKPGRRRTRWCRICDRRRAMLFYSRKSKRIYDRKRYLRLKGLFDRVDGRS